MISLGAVVVTTIGGMLVMAFRIGVFTQRLVSMERRMDSFEDRMDALERRMDALEKKVDSVLHILEVLVREVSEMRVKVEILWQHHISNARSPLSLNENGERILKSSGIDRLMQQRYMEILQRVRSLKPKNIYQVQEVLIKVCSEYKEDGLWRDQLEVAAFQSGCDVGTILYVGSLNIRDQVITDLGFNLEKPFELPHWVGQ